MNAEQIWELFFPPRCLLCGEILAIGQGKLCSDCQMEVQRREGRLLFSPQTQQPEGLEAGFAVFYYEESKEFFADILSKYGVESCLNEKEKRLFNGNCSKQDAIDVVWTYEAYWSLVWALGLIDDISNAVEICDCQKAISLVSECGSLEEFKKQCHVRDIEEILDMLDLYYRYDWACTEKRFNPQTSIGGLNPEVVVERRRGLEWLISEENDWFDISLDT